MRTPTNVFIGGIVAFTLLFLHVSVGDGSASPQAPSQLPQESIGKDGAPMRLVPAGEFLMGSDSSDIARAVQENPGAKAIWYQDEQPRHRVYVDGFYMDKYEVTTARYAQFLIAIAREKPVFWGQKSLNEHGNRPVVGVNWHDAKAYCEWAAKRLPSEAEWEKAARGTDGHIYPWGNDTPTTNLANYGKSWSTDFSSGDPLKPVGSYEAGKSPYGIHDMAGNVWEWVADWYDDGYYKNNPNRNPKGPSSGDSKVLRGGSWGNHPDNLRSADRGGVDPTSVHNAFGFRCLQDIPK